LSDAGLIVIDNKYNLPWELFVSAVGMPGKTAYMGWKEHSHAKHVRSHSLPAYAGTTLMTVLKGETVFVSGGAGPVGSYVSPLVDIPQTHPWL
jgi:NADPH-dependent curcumin reductase CurA